MITPNSEEMYIHDNILICKDVEYIWSKKNRIPLTTLDTIVIHYTAGNTVASTVEYLTSNNTKASSHLLIARRGEIVQMVDFSTQAWHAGKSYLNGRINVNEFSIGIELENAGLLNEIDDHYFSWFKKEIPETEVYELVNPQTSSLSYWQRYSLTQLSTLRTVILLLTKQYNIKNIVGHDEISQGRKIDPGPAFPMKEFKQLLNHFNRTK